MRKVSGVMYFEVEDYPRLWEGGTTGSLVGPGWPIRSQLLQMLLLETQPLSRRRTGVPGNKDRSMCLLSISSARTQLHITSASFNANITPRLA